MLHHIWLLPVGLAIGTFGTLIGAGGGFLLTPLLLLAYPEESPEVITSISLAVVCCNAFSGSLAYARMRRIDYHSGLLFSLATVPGAILGALTTTFLPRQTFDLLFGLAMLLAAAWLVLRRDVTPPTVTERRRAQVTRQLTEADGTSHTFTYNRRLGLGLSVIVGYVSSLLGIGGGIIHVPAMVHALHFPVHVATATSHFTLAAMTLTGTLVHVVTGAFHHGIRRTVILALGVLCGAQLGARLSHHVQGLWIMRSLALALGFAGVRILFMAWR
ncbi:MAG: sulfite exporter TauE/SafE family protein [Candidatus Tectimicrobiota bacterium]